MIRKVEIWRLKVKGQDGKDNGTFLYIFYIYHHILRTAQIIMVTILMVPITIIINAIVISDIFSCNGFITVSLYQYENNYNIGSGDVIMMMVITVITVITVVIIIMAMMIITITTEI